MAAGLKFVPPRVQLCDPRTGIISREWYLFLQGVFDRIGGSTGSSTADVVESLFEDAGSGETNALLFAAEQAAAQAPPDSVLLPVIDGLAAELAALRDELSELRKEIEAIKQGVVV